MNSGVTGTCSTTSVTQLLRDVGGGEERAWHVIDWLPNSVWVSLQLNILSLEIICWVSTLLLRTPLVAVALKTKADERLVCPPSAVGYKESHAGFECSLHSVSLCAPSSFLLCASGLRQVVDAFTLHYGFWHFTIHYDCWHFTLHYDCWHFL